MYSTNNKCNSLIITKNRTNKKAKRLNLRKGSRPRNPSQTNGGAKIQINLKIPLLKSSIALLDSYKVGCTWILQELLLKTPHHKRETIMRAKTNSSNNYRITLIRTPPECERNSGAYMHSISVMPLLKLPDWVAKSVYSKTYLPLGSQSMKK